MRTFQALKTITVIGTLTFNMPAAAALVTFDFEFDNIPNGSMALPTVGTGSMTFDDPGNGSFDFFSLTNIDLSFTFGADSWGNADIATTAGTLVNLSGASGSRDLVFSGVGNGPLFGSIDLINGSNPGGTVLTFGPTGFEGQYHTLPPNDFYGDYVATERTETVPTPATLGLLLLGLFGLPIGRRMRNSANS